MKRVMTTGDLKEQLITFDTAKLANKKGFIGGGTERYNRKGLLNESKAWSISAPTQSLLQKWLLESHYINIEITFNDGNWDIFIGEFSYPDSSVEYLASIECDSFEDAIERKPEALEKGLQGALKTIK